MRGRLAAGRVAALVLGVLITGIGLANSARAFEWDLPGERKFSIHGFYEARLLFTGEDLPATAVTFSQFRHVLSVEFELSLFPDGFGPFDSMFMFTRVLASYDCIYTRACDLFASADSYGDAARKAVRQPASLKADVHNDSPYFAGLLPLKYIPGTTTSPIETLNPSRRYRTCVNLPGTFQNPFPLSVFCNLNQRSPLDGPLKPNLPAAIEVRGGDFSRLARESLLNSARPTLGEAEYTRLRDLLIGGNTLSISQESLRRSLIVQASLAQRAGDAKAAADFTAHADEILGPKTGPGATFDANLAEVLGTRPDPNRFAIFANADAKQLLSAKWGSNKIGKTILPFLATINTPIKPQGYFSNSKSLKWFGAYETGLADDVLGDIEGAPFAADADGNAIIQAPISVKKAVPFFVGPDGVRDTADDLPYVATNPRAAEAGYRLAAPLTGTTDRFDQGAGTPIPFFTRTAQIDVPNVSTPGTTKTVELYGIWNPDYVASIGCANTLHGVYDAGTKTCIAGGNNVTAQAQSVGCAAVSHSYETIRINIGVNADGDCIEVNTSNAAVGGAKIQYEVLNLLGDTRARPAQASSAPLDGSDLRLFGDRGLQIPARPRRSGNGLDFQSPGVSNFYDTHRKVVTNLDLHFTEDELQWNHGASQEEKEFAEGYLEFEMADSQIFARVGKLIVIWGKTELFRNQDRNNPLDIGNGLFGPLEEQRVGQWAADITISPEMFMRVGPIEDLRLELLWIFNKFTPTDLGKCGEGGAVDLICLKSFGAMASGLAAIGVAGERRPDKDYNGMATWDYGMRLEGRLDRFTWAVSDFWGWDDGFYLDLVQQYERTSDITSGAPLSTTQRAGGHCRIRKNAAGQAVGPNGIPGDGDDIFASAGQCLLWGQPFNDPNDPTNPENGRQRLRAPEAIASLHNVNQTLFHSICAYTFDQDNGYCAFDQLNNPDTFGFVSYILGGLGQLGSAVFSGTETIRTQPNGLDQISLTIPSDDFKSVQFLAVNPRSGGSTPFEQDLGLNMTTEQAALLGCGAAYASPCSTEQARIWAADPAITDSLKRTPTDRDPSFGGIDLMNADGSVVTQEFTALKALSPGALVGTRLRPDGNSLEYLPGINYSRDGSVQVIQNTPGNSPDFGFFERGHTLAITPAQVIALGPAGRARFQTDPNDPKQADGWVEPMPWKIDPEAKKKWGAIVFQDDPEAPFDLTSPKNVWNFINPKQTGPAESYSQIDGEYCGRWMNTLESSDFATPFNGGCTALETASANFERFLISTEIIGFDRVFDPPESLTELINYGSGNTDKQAHGDPIAGPDGIFARNAMVFRDDEDDFEVMPLRKPDGARVIDAPPDKKQALDFLVHFDPNRSCTTSAQCLYNVTPVMTDPTDQKSALKIVIDLPMGFTVDEVDEPNDPSEKPVVIGARKVNLAGLEATDLKTLNLLMSGQIVKIADVDNPTRVRNLQMDEHQRENLLGESKLETLAKRDLNGDLINDLDQNKDGIWDGVDDYSPGPITDDNIMCGSGLRGDPFQDAAQYDPYRLDEAPGSAKFKNAFPVGLPPRSPVFCRSIAGILAGTTQTLPVLKAGGNGQFGRRDFLWQGGREVATRYQKRNVFGFGLDFAEDVTKTSWGVEFSWTARKLFANTQEFSGLSQTDDIVLSLSVDRPTFFNFLNPNRSFFVNFQMFVRYLPNYQGGSNNKDGMYQSQKAPWSTQMVLTFFTGYFQDRLAPRVSLVYWPLESQGAAITGLTYRWNDAFSTSIGYSNFFGHVATAQGAYFPIAQYGSTLNYTSAVLGRGAAPVLNRDQMEVRFRYTW